MRIPGSLYGVMCGPVDQSGQALVELAITGSLVLLALAFFIQIGLRMNYQQELEQQTFRRALREAKSEGTEESAAIVINHFRDRQVPDPSFGFALMPRTSTNASATVTWGEHLTTLSDDRDSQPRILVVLNNKEKEFRSEDFQENKDLIKHIHKEFQTINAHAEQTPLVTSLETDTREVTTLTLNTKPGVDDNIQSTLNSPPIRRNW